MILVLFAAIAAAADDDDDVVAATILLLFNSWRLLKKRLMQSELSIPNLLSFEHERKTLRRQLETYYYYLTVGGY